MEMEFEGQEIFEYNSFNSQLQWMRTSSVSKCNTWNQNMTEAMMNSYSTAQNCHSGMYFHHQNQNPAQFQPKYDYYEQQSFYQVCQTNSNSITQPNYDYQLQQNCVGYDHEHYIPLEQPTWHQEVDEDTEGLNSHDFQSSSSSDTSNSLEGQQPHEHKEVNNGDKNKEDTNKSCFMCFVCNMRFARLYHLKRHFESFGHKNMVRESNCIDPADCLLNFYNQPKEYQKYGCQICHKKYKTKISLKRHYQSTHNGVKVGVGNATVRKPHSEITANCICNQLNGTE